MKRVLIIGRPNVGKSSLFNRLIKKRRALVLDTPGVTRDILKEEASWWGGEFEVWDSGGMVWDTSSSIFSSVTLSVRKAIQQVDLIILIVDAHTGLHDEDRRIFELIKNKNYLLVVNKVDHPQKFDDQINEFWKFGIDFITASFEKAENIDCIVDWILKNISDEKQETIEKKKVSLLITGQPNVGKSSLCNKILKMDRMVTSPIAHTTVDIVDEIFDFKGEKYKILDTAGIRKQSRRSGDLEKLASLKTLDFFKKSDFILLLIDGTKEFSRQDIRLLSYCFNQHKAAIIVINKWDLVKDYSRLEWRKKIQESLPFFSNLPVVFTSAKTGLGIQVLMTKVSEYVQKIQIHIPSSKLNTFFSSVTKKAPLPVYRTKNVKFYYATQIRKIPPGFVVFVNEPKGIALSYKKFLIKQIQNNWSLKGIPIQIDFIKKR